MKKPELEIVGGGVFPLWGHCTSCPDAKFPPTTKGAGEIQQRAEIKAAFDRHLVQKHPYEGASQAAARIVREGYTIR